MELCGTFYFGKNDARQVREYYWQLFRLLHHACVEKWAAYTHALCEVLCSRGMSEFAHEPGCSLLGGSCELVTIYNWPYNPTYSPPKDPIGVTPIISRVITPVISSYYVP